MTAEQGYRLLEEIDADRRFLLAAYKQNPALLEQAAPEIRRMFGWVPPGFATAGEAACAMEGGPVFREGNHAPD